MSKLPFNLEEFKQRVGYSGKPQQWKHGFDLAVRELSATPAAWWRQNNERDPHLGVYDCERSALTLGHLTDDELANDVFLEGNRKLSIEEMMNPTKPSPIAYLTAAKERIRWLSRRLNAAPQLNDFQTRIKTWLVDCFGYELAVDKHERNHRFLEEALELVQSTNCTSIEAHNLVDYVFGRDIGDPKQEVGGVGISLAALCDAHNIDMIAAFKEEISRVEQPEVMAAVKVKQKQKPKFFDFADTTNENGVVKND